MMTALQQSHFAALIESILATDTFFARRLRAAGLGDPRSASRDLQSLPLCSKAEILADRLAHSPYGSMLTAPLADYTRFCQTSGTSTGQPMAWLDTPESWQSMLDCWQRVYVGAGLVKGVDSIFFAFSFGPFLGFWTAFEASAQGYLSLPGGGLSSQARLEMMARYQATVLCCTPTYALRLGELIGEESGVPREALAVRKIIVAGEPGGHVPAVRSRIEALWGARVFDHHGMTEVGPVTFESEDLPGFLQVIEEAYFAEVIDPQTLQPVAEGECGELILTTLQRTACPLLRYRTGDWVRRRMIQGRLCLEGGVLGRCDEMVVIRGVNVYPSAIESVVRQFADVTEFQVIQRKVEAMDEIEVVAELAVDVPRDALHALENKLRDTFALRIPVRFAEPGSLPRHEFKSRRWVRE